MRLREPCPATAGALLVNADPFFFQRHDHSRAFAARYRTPPSYFQPRLYPRRRTDDLRRRPPGVAASAYIYVGRILKGEKPAICPVLRRQIRAILNLKPPRTRPHRCRDAESPRATEVIEEAARVIRFSGARRQLAARGAGPAPNGRPLMPCLSAAHPGGTAHPAFRRATRPRLVEGRTLDIGIVRRELPGAIAALAEEVVGLRPSVIMAAPSSMPLQQKRRRRFRSYTALADPVALGLGASIARPAARNGSCLTWTACRQTIGLAREIVPAPAGSASSATWTI